MTAAAAASSRGFRLRQSFSVRASSCLGLMARQPFVLQGDRDGGQGRKPGGECLDERRLFVGFAGKPPRQSDDDHREPVGLGAERLDFLRQFGDLTLETGEGDRLPRARQKAGRIRQREPNPLPTVVDSERPHPIERSTHRKPNQSVRAGEDGPGDGSGHEIIEPSHEIPGDAGHGDSARHRRSDRTVDVLVRSRAEEPVLAEDGDPRLRRDGPGPRRTAGPRRQASEHQAADRSGRPLPAWHHTLGGVADRVGVVCDRRESGQAQHLRFPGPRHRDLPARSRNGPPRAGALSVRVCADCQAEGAFDPRRHLVLGDARAVPACAPAS